MLFEWDEAKAESNERKHGISFDQVLRLFQSESDSLELFDEENSLHEDRFIAIGVIEQGLVVVSWCESRDDVVRIIGARRATRREEQVFERRMRYSK